MTVKELQELRQQARESLARIQDFNVEQLPQTDRLGTEHNFQSSVGPTERLIALYKQLPADVLDVLPSQPLQQIKTQADADYGRFTEILEFQVDQGDVTNRINSLVEGLENAYEPAFIALHPWISYSVRRTTDFTRLEQEARATVQQLRDDAEGIKGELHDTKTEAMAILEEVRRVAEEQGVSQQATYFKQAADEHNTQAKQWLKATVKLAAALGVYAIASIFIHKWSWLTPTTGYEAVQLAVSKVLIFAVLSYMLVLAARNYLAQRHNAIINKHRQDALMTYEALVKAGKDASNRDIVLTHAAVCIFEAKPTGFAKSEGSDTSAVKSLVGVIASGANSSSE